jgi:prepilin-type N-terminal cleavage/methylation domain-containing protein
MSRRSDTAEIGTATGAGGGATDQRAGGFTLVEVMVAMTILAIVLLGFLSTRSQALADAIQARNWRLARSIAEEQLSKLQAGGNEFRPEPMPVDVEGYPGFRYVILIGEQAIANAEAEIDSLVADYDASQSERRTWQRDRDDIRSARQKGVSLDDYRQQLLASESDPDAVPSEDEFEEVAVIVYFPNVSLGENRDRDEETFILKARVATLAIHGLTPEQARSLAAQKGLTSEGGTGTGGPASLTAGGTGNDK